MVFVDASDVFERWPAEAALADDIRFDIQPFRSAMQPHNDLQLVRNLAAFRRQITAATIAVESIRIRDELNTGPTSGAHHASRLTMSTQAGAHDRRRKQRSSVAYL